MRRILLLGNFKGAAKAALEGASKQIGASLIHWTRTDEAIRDIDRHRWHAVLVDITTPGAVRFCHEARARRSLFHVPLLGLTPQLTDLAFSNAFRWGADDVVLLGLAAPVATRLIGLSDQVPLLDPTRGEAVIADPDRGRCDVMGRVLANAGYTVRYATDVVSARFYLNKPNVRLFVLNGALTPPVELVAEARALGNRSDWVVTTKQRHLETVRRELGRFEQVVVMSSHGSPENVLFALDFLHPSKDAARRSQVRALHGTMVLFRPQGEVEDECGYTFSVSANGVYVRTLAPPPRGELWLELEAPNTGRRVRLIGTVVWSRTFGEGAGEMAPPGFGVHITSGLGTDLTTWQGGFATLAGTRGHEHQVPEVHFTPQPFRVPRPNSLIPKRIQPVESSPKNVMPGQTSLVPRPAGSKAPENPTPSAADKTSNVEPVKPLRQELVRLQGTEPDLLAGPRHEVKTAAAADAASSVATSHGELANKAPPKTRRTFDSASVTSSTKSTALKALATTQPQVPRARTHVPESENTESVTSPATLDTEQERGPMTPVPMPTRTLQASLTSGFPAEFANLPPRRPASIDVEPANETSHEPSISSQGPDSLDRPTPTAIPSKMPSRRSSQPTIPTRSTRPVVAALIALVCLVGLVMVTTTGEFSSRTRSSALPAAPPVDEESSPSHELSSEVVALADPRSPDSIESPRVMRTGTETIARELTTPKSTDSSRSEPAEVTETEPEALTPPGGEEDAASEATPVPDVKTLAEDEAWLFVRSPLQTRVFVHGVDLGSTNQWLRSKCGMRFLRLGAEPGQWLSRGRPEKLGCRQLNRVELRPTTAAR